METFDSVLLTKIYIDFKLKKKLRCLSIDNIITYFIFRLINPNLLTQN